MHTSAQRLAKVSGTYFGSSVFFKKLFKGIDDSNVDLDVYVDPNSFYLYKNADTYIPLRARVRTQTHTHTQRETPTWRTLTSK